MTTTLSTAVRPGSRPALALGLPSQQGAVLAVLWDASGPLTAAQIANRLGWQDPGGASQALGRLRALGLATATSHRPARWRATLGRDGYLAALIAAALDQAADPPGVLRAALRTPPG